MIGPRFSAALSFVAELHGAQVRKGTEIPYASHLLSVAALVLKMAGMRTRRSGLCFMTLSKTKAHTCPWTGSGSALVSG
jgi:hypothetical protein